MENTEMTGATLLFAGAREGKFEALLHSYVFACSSLEELERIAVGLKPDVQQARGEKSVDWQLLGIQDLFCTVGPVSEGAMLGRSTLTDVDDRANANKLVSPAGEPIARSNARCPSTPLWAIAQAIYFVAEDSDQDTFTIVANILLDWREQEELDAAAQAVCRSHEVIRRICQAGSEEVSDLCFLGIETIYHVCDDIKASGAFLKLSRTFDSLEEITELVESRENLALFEFPSGT